ncbi:MAG: carboxypeptidase regulatory-like domain-containing protein [Bryobacteraceae bacterium]
MATRLFSAIFITLAGLAPIRAADIEGMIVVKHKLTKPKVTASASSYARGAAVELGSGGQEDPLAFERTRVAIYLEGDLPSKPVAATMEQKNRQFLPDTVVIPAGSTVSFPNLDAIFHNVFSLSKPKTFDLGNYSRDHTRTVTFPKPGIVFVHCHLHPNMAAAIVVSPNGWNAKADAAGRFTLRSVPQGRYTVVAWHKAAGFFRQTVQVRENRGATVEFLIPLDEDGIAKEVARR